MSLPGKGPRLLAPALIVMLAVTAWPVGRALYTSLYNDPFTNPDARTFVGFDNYTNLLSSGEWWRSIAWAMSVVVLVVAAQMVLGFLFAHVLNQLIRLLPVARILVLLPFAAMAFLSAFTWHQAFTNGYLNDWFRFDSLGDGGAMLGLCLSEIWRGTGIVAVILVIGLQRVSPGLMESAIADGATAFQRFTRIVIPSVAPAAAIAGIYRVLDTLRAFEAPFAAARPGSDLNSPQTWIFDTTLNRFEFGLGATMSIVFLLLSGLLGLALFWILRIRRAL